MGVEKKKAGGKAEEKELTKEKEYFNEENTVIKTTGIPIKKKKKVLKTGQKRRTRNAPSTRSLNIKEDNKLQGVSKKIKTRKRKRFQELTNQWSSVRMIRRKQTR